MRTPREILLKHHQVAEPKLDAIREQVERGHLVRESHRETRGQDVRAPMWWREFFRLPRIAWAGLAAAWAVIIALNVASSETSSSPRAVAAASTRRSPEMLQALREQKRLFAELVGSASESSDADTRRFVPRPRSETAPQTSIA
jgi:hypothetical protein